MANWKYLTTDDLRLALSEDELERLGTLSLDDSKLSVVLQQTLDNAADAFRAAWAAKGYQLDPRDHYISTGYSEFVLSFARWNLWCRFPMSDNYALSEPRKLQYEKAVELLKDPWLNTDKVNWNDPELSGYVELSAQTGSSISVPWQRMDYDIYWFSGHTLRG